MTDAKVIVCRQLARQNIIMVLVFLAALLFACCNPASGIIELSSTIAPLCRNDWHKVRMGFETTKCIKIVKQNMSWSEASRSCHQEVGSLLNSIQEISMFSKQSFISLLSADGIYPLYWIGLHVDKTFAQKLVWDGLPPRRYEDSGQRIWHWESGEPNESENCIAVRYLPPSEDYPMLEELTDYFNPNIYEAVTVTSGCGLKKYFICQADLVEYNVYLNSSCEDGWVSNNGLATCYMVFSEKLENFRGATETCKRQGGSLAMLSSSFEQAIIVMVAKWFALNDGYFENNQFESWVITSTREQCTYIANNQTSWTSRVTTCSFEIPFMCQMPKQLNDISSVELSIKTAYDDQEELSNFRFGTRLPVTCQLTRQLTDLEEVYFYRNGELINTNRYVHSKNPLLPYQVNITVPHNTEELEFPNTAELGYYWCSVLTKFPYQFIQSVRTLVRYAYNDFMVFLGKATLVDRIPKAEYIAHNLLGMYYYEEEGDAINVQNNLNELVSSVTSRVTRILISSNIQIGTSKVTLRHFSNNGTDVTFMLYVSLRSRVENVFFAEPAVLKEYRNGLKQQFDFGIPRRKKREPQNGIRSVSLRSTVFCPKKEFATGLVILQTPNGQQGASSDICIKDNMPLVVAKCEGGYYAGTHWGPETIKEECIPSNLETSKYTETLNNLSKIVVTVSNIRNVSGSLSNMTADTTALTPLDLIYSAQILKNIAKIFTLNLQTLEDVLDTANNILNVPQTVVDEARKYGSAPTRIVEAVEEMSEKIYLKHGGKVKIVRDNVAVQVWKVSRGNLGVIGLKLNNNDTEVLAFDSLVTLTNESDVTYPSLDIALVLPQKILSGNITLMMQLYNTDKFFRTPSGKSQQYAANSKIIGAKLIKDGSVISDLGVFNVTSVFVPVQAQKEPTCGYWNYSGKNNAGAWDTEGCYFDGYIDNRAVCKCDHLTNFAILLDFYGNDKLPEEHKLALHIITMIGVCLSIAGLSMTILSFILLKKLRKGRAQQTLFNLALAMLCSLIVFVAGISEIGDRAGCITVAVLMHYFILVSFMWMLMEAILQYLQFVKVLGTYIPNFMWKTAIPAWGLPVIPVAIVCGIDYNLYFGGYEYCWMSLTPFYYAFAIPLGVIIIVNLIVFVIVIASLFCKPKGLRSSQSEKQRQLRNFQAALTVFILLGLTWMFGYLALEDAQIVFKYIFCIVGSLQGFLIFILFTAREQHIRKYVGSVLCCCVDDKRKAAYTTRGISSTDTNSKVRSDSTTDTSLISVSATYIRKGSGK